MCVHNAARSQMAEGFVNALHRGHYQAYSAGQHPLSISPYAEKAMKEIGIDISQQRSKSLEQFRGRHFNYVVSLCDEAKLICPVFTNAEIHLHKSFRDPGSFGGTGEEILKDFRGVRDEIRCWIEETFGQKDQEQ